MDTASLIIAICVAIPAVITLTVCGIILYSHRNKNRKFNRQTGSSDEYHDSHERGPQDDRTIDFPRPYRYQQQRRLREPPPIFEQSSPSYDSCSINQTRRQPLPLVLPIRTTPSTTNVRLGSLAVTPSIYATMPPSYAELFLTPQTLPNR